MNGITEEKINKNYILWMEQLKKYDCYSESFIEEYGELIKNASFAMKKDSGCAYKGSLLEVVLYNLCAIANHINENGFGVNTKGKIKHPTLYVNKDSLMKVLLLQHISKAKMFVPTTETWKISKGIYYDFADLPTTMKLGERSIFMCMTHSIRLTEEEYDAIRILDREESTINGFMTPLAQIVKTANQFAAIELSRSKL